MCIGSNWVNHAQDLMFVTKFEDFPNSLIPNGYCTPQTRGAGRGGGGAHVRRRDA